MPWTGPNCLIVKVWECEPLPELPEVETVRRGLEPELVGRRLVRVEQRRPDLRFPLPERFAERLAGRRITALRRRAKYLIAEIDTDEMLVMHLGMTGRFTIARGSAGFANGMALAPDVLTHELAPAARHDHIVFYTDHGAVVTYNDARRFGFMLLVGAAEIASHPLFAALGPEPLGNALNAPYLASRASGRTTDLKAFLMDQRNIAGLGNIYVCEALYRAGLSPTRSASSLATRTSAPTIRAERLVPAIVGVLNDAIAAGGSSLRDYRQASGELGYFQHTFAVYGREGEPCVKPDCTGTIRRITQAGRSTFYCPRCQR